MPETCDSEACIHCGEAFYVGLGHPRCGTGFTSSLIKNSGLDVGHETVGRNGIISWMLAGEKYRNPYYDAIGPLKSFRNIFLVARSPISSIPSIIPENTPNPSLRFRRRILRERLGYDPIGPRSGASAVTRAVASYVNWLELCLTFEPQIIFRVDHEEDDAVLSDYLGREVRRTPDIYRNSHPDRRGEEVSIANLSLVPRDLLKRLQSLSDRLGYVEDSRTIARARKEKS